MPYLHIEADRYRVTVIKPSSATHSARPAQANVSAATSMRIALLEDDDNQARMLNRWL